MPEHFSIRTIKAQIEKEVGSRSIRDIERDVLFQRAGSNSPALSLSLSTFISNLFK
jgi:hypothetical protein